MKKWLAILLAALMALTGALALAEGGDALDAPEGFPGLTMVGEYTVDREVLANALTTFGVPEGIAGIADNVAAVLSEAGERLIVASDGVEYALTLKGNDIVNLVGQLGDDGVLLGSNLIPNTVLTLSFDTVAQVMEQVQQQLGSALEGVDVDQVVEALGEYFEQFTESCVSAVTLGEPEQGEYEVNGIQFNARVAVNVDMAAIVEAEQTLVKQLAEDETLQAALQALQEAGVQVSSGDIEQTNDAALSDEALPRLEMWGYMQVDEAGDAGDTVDVTFEVYAPDSEEAATVGDVLVQDDAVTVNVDFVTADSQLVVAYVPADNGGEVRLDATVQGVYGGFDFRYAVADEGVALDADLFVLDEEKPLASEHCEISLGGELTLVAKAPGKGAVAVEDLIGENGEEALGTLVSDLTQSGLGGVVSAALEAMPEEITALAGLFMNGGADAPAA